MSTKIGRSQTSSRFKSTKAKGPERGSWELKPPLIITPLEQSEKKKA